jgi:anti-sigma factor RsiW
MNARDPRSERPPSPDELLAMAYTDGELEPDQRATFEQRLQHEPALSREVAALLRLNVLAREVAPREPEDLEWARIGKSRPRAWVLTIAWCFLLIDVLAVIGFGVFEFSRSEAPILFKAVILGGLLAFLVWFWLVVRARIRTLPYDPYTEVKR